MNNFDNDGSFIERFKKIRESQNPATNAAATNEKVPDKTVKQEELRAEVKPSVNDAAFLRRFKLWKKAADTTKTSANPADGSAHNCKATSSGYVFPASDSDPHEKSPPTGKCNYSRVIKTEHIDDEKPISESTSTLMLREVKSELDYDATESPELPSTSAAPQSSSRKRRSRWDATATESKRATFELPLQPDQVKLEPPGIVAFESVSSSTTLTPGPFPNASLNSSFSASFDASFSQKLIGSSEMSDEHKKQLQEQAQLRILQQQIQSKQTVMKAREQAVLMGKAKPIFEYDSDEDAEDGTWEHKIRKMEMEKTKDVSNNLTSMAKGKHHIGQFLPTEELEKFFALQKAVAAGKSIDKSDYQEAKLTENNKGYKLLQKMGWTEGKGLGAEEQGIVAPINKGKTSGDNEGLGATSSNDVSANDDEYDLYRKRMMLAYRFRPNPLNNPRRPYY